MASDPSFDITAQFDLQEVRNAVDQTKKEVSTRFDFRGLHIEIELNDDMIKLVAPGEMKIKAVGDVLLQKIINRKLSPKILDFQKAEPSSGELFKQEVKLLKVLDQETCKTITKELKENFPKVKGSIQGDVVRVAGKNKDDLQAVITHLRSKGDSFKLPLNFGNYR